MIAYLDCFSGAAGDMILAALLDAGADPEPIRKQLTSMGLAEVDIRTSRTHRRGIAATHLQVISGDRRLVADYPSVLKLADWSHLEEPVADFARRVLERLTEAEARVHGVPPDEVRFHEIDAADTVVDIVGTALALSQLEVDRVVCSPVATGSGEVATAHGTVPVPAPATLELLKGLPTYGRDLRAELVTPTGAALIATMAESFGPPPPMKVRSIGYGAGTADLEIPNVVRVTIGEATEAIEAAVEELLIETNIDDMNPEIYEYLQERLATAGVTDVWITPTIGKRGRPSAVVSVLAPVPLESSVKDILVSETSTLGVRTSKVGRWMLDREWIEVDIEGIPVRVKVARQGGRVVNVSPEYFDCADVARRTGRPVKEIFRQALAEYERR